MPKKNQYWRSLAERNADPERLCAAEDEFAEELPVPAARMTRRGMGQWLTSILPVPSGAPGDDPQPGPEPGIGDRGRRSGPTRRDFLKAAGFTFAIATAAGCSRAPVQKAIPLLRQPEEIIPGRSFYYASTCGGCSAGCGVVVKVRDGRPIKLEGNPQHAVSRGGLCAAGQASILGLYDVQRLRNPLKHGSDATWETVDREITGKLAALRAGNGAVRFLTGTITSPTLKAEIAEFLKTFPEGRHVQYDGLSHSAILDAHERTHGVRALPNYHFDQAEVVASFDADFLGTWISPVQFTADHRKARDLEAKPPHFSYHAQFESRMSITGSKADRRVAVAPGEAGEALSVLAAALAKKAGADLRGDVPAPPASAEAVLADLVQRLWAAQGRSLVVSGSNDPREQVLVNFVNHALGNYGKTLDIEQPSLQAQGSDGELEVLLGELRAGKVNALFVCGANPAYDLPRSADVLKNVPLLVSFSERRDETASLAHYVCPDRHNLEAWGDAEPVAGYISVIQPAIRPLADTRPVLESLAAWSGRPQPVYEILRRSWQTRIYPRRTKPASFEEFWDSAVHDGCVEIKAERLRTRPFDASTVASVAATTPTEGFEAVLYPTVAMQDGRHAYNPWLQELPDPVNKITWDNCASLSPAAAQKLGVEDGDVVRVEVAGAPAVEAPAYMQPGQHDSVVAVALGYGSRLSARFADIGPRWLEGRPSVGENGLVGVNAAPLLKLADGALRYVAPARISKTGRSQPLATTQAHQTLSVPQKLAPPDGSVRPIVQDTTLAAFLKDPRSGVEEYEEKEDLWPADHPYNNLRWGMVVDLAACTGCSACVVACQAENNIPVVGKDEIRRNREMHWLRVDRYYTDLPDGEVVAAYQPMMCQQCENAPCETVCPVLATVHSEDGLNSQVYNRCVGTRYCANNCPYKGRRFNWFSYSRNDQLQNLVLNPDVTVRSRGVMEKCTFCVQRLQEAKIEAKRRGTRVEDGAVQTACQQSCPAQAIYFGDLNDPNSRVRRMMQNPRRYRVLAELNVRPSVGYLTVVRNRPEEETEEKKNG